MHYTHKRPAIAMIELIFAIVVMGIVMMSAPTLISTATQTTTVALQQASINEAASQINIVLTYSWDENDTNSSCEMPPVLHVTAGDIELDEVGTTARRVGVPLASSSHTFKCKSTEFSASSLGTDGADVSNDDMDDFSGAATLINLAGGAGGVDYIEQTTVQMTTAITYVEDNITAYSNQTITYIPGAVVTVNTSNIKHISVTLTSTSTANELNQKKIILNAFSCNIGGYRYESRTL